MYRKINTQIQYSLTDVGSLCAAWANIFCNVHEASRASRLILADALAFSAVATVLTATKAVLRRVNPPTERLYRFGAADAHCKDNNGLGRERSVCSAVLIKIWAPRSSGFRGISSSLRKRRRSRLSDSRRTNACSLFPFSPSTLATKDYG